MLAQCLKRALHGKDLGAFLPGGQSETCARQSGAWRPRARPIPASRSGRRATPSWPCAGGDGAAWRFAPGRSESGSTRNGRTPQRSRRRQHLAQLLPPAGRDAGDGNLVPLALDHVDVEFVDADGGRLQRLLQEHFRRSHRRPRPAGAGWRKRICAAGNPTAIGVRRRLPRPNSGRSRRSSTLSRSCGVHGFAATCRLDESQGRRGHLADRDLLIAQVQADGPGHREFGKQRFHERIVLCVSMRQKSGRPAAWPPATYRCVNTLQGRRSHYCAVVLVPLVPIGLMSGKAAIVLLVVSNPLR